MSESLNNRSGAIEVTVCPVFVSGSGCAELSGVRESCNMLGIKIAVCVSSACASMAIIAVLIVVPSLFMTINEMQDELLADMDTFKVRYMPAFIRVPYFKNL
jgi:hypothetical protein